MFKIAQYFFIYKVIHVQRTKCTNPVDQLNLQPAKTGVLFIQLKT